MNIQYVTNRGLARYITKYIAKPEPSHLFNIHESTNYREYIHARRMGSMEIMLLLGEKICNSSIQVMYLITDPPSICSKAIKPLSLLNSNDDEPYWTDHIEKYFNRPDNEIFENIMYQEYYKNYEIKNSINGITRNNTYIDKLANQVIKRNSPILTRIRYLTTEYGELYFYQQLLLSIPARSEDNLKEDYNTYRDHFLSKFPERFSETIEQNRRNHHLQTINMIEQFN
ncbi:hypothetical protein Glove_304g8 [Diversispora epigaea]|uniref:Helitron helicase-like domain-containing protein n=1 Tax=Diversispora epigaea TaxID=1348612 RepID=A0A397HV04_9GLOM|nr:hypothetical protein Glove_304g8 [Diversispora epigaea]